MSEEFENPPAGQEPIAPPPPPVPALPSLPSPEPLGESGAESSRRVASWSFWLRIAAVLLALASDHVLAGASSRLAFFGTLAATGTCLLLVAASLVLAIVALSGVFRYGASGVLWRSIRGIVTCLIFFSYFGHTIFDAVRADMQNRQALAELRQAGNKVRAETREDLEERGPASVSNASASNTVQRIEEAKAALDTAAQHATGDTALVLQGTAAMTGRLQGLVTNYAAAARALLEPPILNMSSVTKRGQLLAKKEIVRKFMAANEKLEAFYVNAGDNYRRELEKSQLPLKQVEETLAGFQKQAGPRISLALKMREADQRKGTALMGMLDVLDDNWDRWHYNPDTKKVVFDSDAALDKYITYRQAMDAAAQEQTRLQAQMVTLASN